LHLELLINRTWLES